MSTSEDDVLTLKAAFRNGDIEELRGEGWSYPEIAEHIGVPVSLLHAVRTGKHGSWEAPADPNSEYGA